MISSNLRDGVSHLIQSGASGLQHNTVLKWAGPATGDRRKITRHGGTSLVKLAGLGVVRASRGWVLL